PALLCDAELYACDSAKFVKATAALAKAEAELLEARRCGSGSNCCRMRWGTNRGARRGGRSLMLEVGCAPIAWSRISLADELADNKCPPFSRASSFIVLRLVAPHWGLPHCF